MKRKKPGVGAPRGPAWRRGRRRFARSPFKRLFDGALSATALLLLAPVLLSLGLVILVRSGRPVVFRHPRVGRGGRPFGCFKFRTMARDADAMLAAHLAGCAEARAEWEATRKLRDDPRVLGRFGRLLRRTSIDELPQLLNVLRGDMSLVGPRPVMADELGNYDDQARWYLSVRPGLTGPWQVEGRSDTSYAERVALDVHYAKNATFRSDLAILLKTLVVVITGRGAR